MKNYNNELTKIAVNCLFNSKQVYVLDDQEYIQCNMCVSHDGKMILSCSKQEPANGVLVLLKGDSYNLHVIGDSVPVNTDSVYHAKYQKYFPGLSDLSGLVTITPLKYTLIDESNNESVIENLSIENIFHGEVENRMTEHMNDDHIEAMQDYCRLRNINIHSKDPLMLGVDTYGFDLLVNNQPTRFQFDNECETPQEVREALVDMAKRARQ